MVGPEDKAREKIDQQLIAAGWLLQDADQFNRKASLGVAVREFQLTTGPCDYLLFVDGKLMAASSMGRFYNGYIKKGRFDCRKGYVPSYQ